MNEREIVGQWQSVGCGRCEKTDVGETGEGMKGRVNGTRAWESTQCTITNSLAPRRNTPKWLCTLDKRGRTGGHLATVVDEGVRNRDRARGKSDVCWTSAGVMNSGHVGGRSSVARSSPGSDPVRERWQWSGARLIPDRNALDGIKEPYMWNEVRGRRPLSFLSNGLKRFGETRQRQTGILA